MIVDIIIILISMFACGAFAGYETGHYTINKVRLQFRVESGDRKAIILNNTMRDSQVFIFTMLIGTNLCVHVASTLVTELYMDGMGQESIMLLGFIPWSAEMAATLTLMLPFFVFAEAGPKNLFRKRTILMYQSARILRFFTLICLPLTLPLKYLAKALTASGSRDFGHELQNLSMHRLRFFLSESQDEGIISESQSGMIHNILEMNEVPLTEVMIPFEEMVTLPADVTGPQFKASLKAHYYNSVPIFEGEKMQIVGSLNYFDAITATAEKKPLKAYIHPFISVDATLSLQQVFYALQNAGETAALVVDSSGKLKGMVKLKSILKRITC